MSAGTPAAGPTVGHHGTSPRGDAAESNGSRRGRRAVGRRVGPWLVGVGILSLLFWKIPLATVGEALRDGPWLALSLLAVCHLGTVLVADGWATWVSLLAVGVRRPLQTVVRVRGATYLLGLLNYALGQGGIGLYLLRTGLTTRRAAGTVFFLLLVNAGALVVLAAAGLLLGAASPDDLPVAPAIGVGLACLALYLGLITFPLHRLSSSETLRPLLAAGLQGHLMAGSARLLHVGLLAVGHWLALRLWGIAVPLERGLVLMPIVLFVAALPLAPAGLGTTQASQVLLFAPYAAATTAQGRAAAVLALAVAYYALSLLVQALLGLVCLHRLRRNGELRPPPGEVSGVRLAS